MLAPGRVIENVGCGPCVDIEAVMTGVRWTEVHEVASDGAVIAILLTGGDTERLSRGTLVLTLDGDDRATSVRAYWRCGSAVSADALHPSLHLALPRSPEYHIN